MTCPPWPVTGMPWRRCGIVLRQEVARAGGPNVQYLHGQQSIPRGMQENITAWQTLTSRALQFGWLHGRSSSGVVLSFYRVNVARHAEDWMPHGNDLDWRNGAGQKAGQNSLQTGGDMRFSEPYDVSHRPKNLISQPHNVEYLKRLPWFASRYGQQNAT